MCPLGTVQYVQSQYQNLAERTVEGVDVAAYYDWDNDYGSWSFRYRGAFTTKLEQLAAPGTSAATLQKGHCRWNLYCCSNLHLEYHLFQQS
jgi:outer membrane receptor protein involved in Fe transport